MYPETLLHMLQDYIQRFTRLREDSQDIPDLELYRTQGLAVTCPECWNFLGAICDLIPWYVESFAKASRVLVIYPSSVVYRKIYSEQFSPFLDFFGWHELYVAMVRATQDARFMQDLKNRIKTADLVIFVGQSAALPDVVDMVRASCRGCLLLIE